MTTDTDKLVEMARAAGGISLTYVAKPIEQSVDGVAMTPAQLAAFASAHIASLCGDVEPTFWLYELGDKEGVYLGVTGDKAQHIATQARTDEMGDGPVFGLCAASTVAALKARVSELEKNGPVVQIGTRGDGTAAMGTMREALGLMETAATAEAQFADELKAERDAALARVAVLEAALERIASPIPYEQANVPEGCKLNGHALLAQLDRPEYYQSVARSILKGQP